MNLRPSGYEPDELPDCSTPRHYKVIIYYSTFLRKYASGWRWIRTTESVANRFTVCPLWPLGNPSIIPIKLVEPTIGLEPVLPP